MSNSRFFRLLLGACLAFAAWSCSAELAASVPATASTPEQRSLVGWLMRMHDASRGRSYTGTLVVSSGERMSSSRVWHVCDGDQQIERVQSLTGAPRSTFRRDDEVVTFSPQSRVAVVEKREMLGQFPDLLKSSQTDIDRYYSASTQGSERVAGFDADIVQVQPRDTLRFGYRIWSEKQTGLVVKMQTVDAHGSVLEQMAFTELKLDAPLDMKQLGAMMGDTHGYRVESREPVRTTAQSEGWALRQPVAGFRAMSCYRRPAAGGSGALQWVFSDGLASVSVFIEPYDSRRRAPEGLVTLGATHTLTRRWPDSRGAWWLTLVGEVPTQTLQSFAQALERTR